MKTKVKILTKEEILLYLLNHKGELRTFGVSRIGLFGSFVRNEQTKESDIDFLVDYQPEKKNLKNFFGLLDWLEDAFQREIELITREALSPYIGPHIEKEVEYVTSSN